MTPLQSLYTDAMFRLSGLTWLEGLDLLLVTVAFYLLLNLLQRSRAGFLLRGTLALSAVLLIVTIVLPLPAFDWLVRVSLIALFVGTPIIFQPELRRLLERLGRNTGIARAVRQTKAEKVLSVLTHAVENLARNKTGALIALEGNDSLQEMIETGVHFGGQITSELLQSIFYPGTPLHDGAVIVREDQVVAAGCVLPLTQDPLCSERRLGTRHRAAVGLSERRDALVIVVSEETGEISVAQHGQLRRPLRSTTLREQVFNFYAPSMPGPPTSLSFIERARWRVLKLPALRRTLSYTGLLLVSLLLGLAAWSFVVEQTNPARWYRVDNIPLRVVDVPPDQTLMTSPPATVSAIVKTTADLGPTLRPGSFQAVVSVKGLPAGLHRPVVQVNSSASQVRVLSVDPPALDLELAPVISRTLPVTIDLPDQKNLSPAYIIASDPAALPQEVKIIGAEPLVEQVSRVQATISLANAGASVQEIRPLRALDQDGHEVTGVSLDPAQVQVSVPIRQRSNARDVGVRVVPGGPPPNGYWLSGLNATPASVALQGSPDQLSEIGSFVDTLPVDLSQVYGDVEIQVPLDLSNGVQALDSNTGNVVRTVTVQAHIKARSGDLVVTRPVELLNATPGVTTTISPSEVDLLLSGPLPTLNQIDAASDLVRVWVDAGGLTPGKSVELVPSVLTPEGIKAQTMPPSVLVTMSNPPYAWSAD